MGGMATEARPGQQRDDVRAAEARGSDPSAPSGRRAADRDSVLGAAVAWVARWSLRVLLIAAALIGICYALAQFWVIVRPVVLALLLSSVLWPPVKLLRRKLPPALAVLLVLLVAALALTGLGLWVVPQVVGQFPQLADTVGTALSDLQRWLTGPPLNLGRDQVGSVVDQATAALKDNATAIAGGVLAGVSTFGSILANAVLALVLSFFFLKDGPRFLPWLSEWVGPRAAPHVSEVLARAWSTLSGFITAQAAVALVDAVGIGIGLVVLDVPLALPLAVLIFFGAFIPFVGAFVTGALAAVVALVSNGLLPALIVVALILVVQALEGNVLEPLLMSRALDLHPAVILLSVTAGGALFGILGAFLAVPVVAVLSVVFGYAHERLTTVAAAAAAAD